MQHEVKKITCIVNELITMLLLMGAEEVDVKIKRGEKSTSIHLVQYNCTFDDTFMEKLRYNLNTIRQYEVEGYYWQLVGENDLDEETFLVGAMVDQSDVRKENGNLYIDLVRKNDCK